MHARVKKLNPHANTPAAVKMNEINPKYENTRKLHRLLTNQNPGFLYMVWLIKKYFHSHLSWYMYIYVTRIKGIMFSNKR